MSIVKEEHKATLRKWHEELQEKRYQAAYILDSLNALTPDNTYLTALEAETLGWRVLG